jgi:hypothetical protein
LLCLVRRLWLRLPVLNAKLDAGVIDGARVRASIASWLGYAHQADAFRPSRALFVSRDVRNTGKRLPVQAVGRGLRIDLPLERDRSLRPAGGPQPRYGCRE